MPYTLMKISLSHLGLRSFLSLIAQFKNCCWYKHSYFVSGHAHHGHSHGHSHSHDFGHSHGSGLDYGHGIGSGTEAYVQASIADTHRRAHAIAGPLSAGTHRELHRLLKNRYEPFIKVKPLNERFNGLAKS